MLFMCRSNHSDPIHLGSSRVRGKIWVIKKGGTLENNVNKGKDKVIRRLGQRKKIDIPRVSRRGMGLEQFDRRIIESHNFSMVVSNCLRMYYLKKQQQHNCWKERERRERNDQCIFLHKSIKLKWLSKIITMSYQLLAMQWSNIIFSTLVIGCVDGLSKISFRVFHNRMQKLVIEFILYVILLKGFMYKYLELLNLVGLMCVSLHFWKRFLNDLGSYQRLFIDQQRHHWRIF